MILKNSLAGLDHAGDNAVINLPEVEKTPELIKEFGKVLNALEGQYITADDVGSQIAGYENS